MMADDEENLEDYLERALTVSRRSVFFIDDSLQEFSEELINNISKVDNYNDETLVRSVAETLHGRDGGSRRIDALSMEVTPKDQSQSSKNAVTFRHSIFISAEGDIVNVDDPDANVKNIVIVKEIIDEVLDIAINISTNRGAMELYFYHPLANKNDIEKMTDTFAQTRSSLTDQASRLKTAMKIILVMAAKQIVVSYRRILTEQAERLASGEDTDQVTMETCQRCLDVTERVAELAVIYLKAATRDVIDTSVNDVRIILGRMNDSENSEIEELTKL